MSKIIEYESLLRLFAERIGLTPADAFVAHQEMRIDHRSVGFALRDGQNADTGGASHDPEFDLDQQVWYFTSLAVSPARLLVEDYRLLLEANHFWQHSAGGTLSIDPVSGSLFLCAKSALMTLDAATLAACVAGMIDAAATLEGRLDARFSDAARAANNFGKLV